MTRDEFCTSHWEYYLVLEKDFLQVERFISFDLGDNYLYDGVKPTDIANSEVYSVEFVKQYQAICSEIDVILKTICAELGNASADNITQYANEVLADVFWKNIVAQKVKQGKVELAPFINWKPEPSYNSPDWWSPYNKVKHTRKDNMRKANLKNVLNALAGLYALEQYLAKYIGDRDGERDVPNDVSHLFEMVNWETEHTVFGKDSYMITEKEVLEMLDS